VILERSTLNLIASLASAHFKYPPNPISQSFEEGLPLMSAVFTATAMAMVMSKMRWKSARREF